MKRENNSYYKLNSTLHSFKEKENKTLNLIEKSLSFLKKPYIAFSGGKDSTVMLHLISRISKDIPVITEISDFDFDFKKDDCERIVSSFDIKDYRLLYNNNLKERFLTTGHTYWYDVVINFIQEYSPDGVFIGIRAEENKKTRAWAIKKHGLIHQYTDNNTNRKLWQSGLVRVAPLGYWSGVDVFSYIVKYDLPYCRIYDNDKFCKPHELRFGWVFYKDQTDLSLLWLKYYYNDIFEELRRSIDRLNRV